MLFKAVGGLGIFLLGMRHLSDGMQAIAGNRLRTLIGAVTNNRLIAVTVGFLFTAVIQSSSVTTVMVVGLVNSGVMTLLQAIGVIMGANIGTTITGWILVLKIGKYGLPLLGFASFFYLFSKNERTRFTAGTLMGIGMIFFGLSLMKSGFKPLRAIPEFADWFALFDATTYIGIIGAALMGCLLTFMVQSSSATLAITMGLSSAGVIGFDTAAALVLGENIGTTITAVLASLGTSRSAKRAAYAHIIFNMIGVLWVIAVFPFYLTLVKKFLGVDPGMMVIKDGGETFPYIIMGIATVHSGFNITNTLIFIPFVRHLEKLLHYLVPESTAVAHPQVTKLDSSLLETPAVAAENVHMEILKMSAVVEKMMSNLVKAVGGDAVQREYAERIFNKEKILDDMQNEISVFLTDLLAESLPHEITEESRRQLRMADEYESISDYITKILKLHLRLREANLELPPQEKSNIADLHKEVMAYMEFVNKGCSAKNRGILADARPQGDAITDKIRGIRTLHISQLSERRKDPMITMVFTDMINSYRRVKDHALNIAEAIAGEK
jgi:phosphate:Na+ symporter